MPRRIYRTPTSATGRVNLISTVGSLHPRPRRPGHRRTTPCAASARPPGRAGPVEGQHPGVVHTLAAAAAQLRRHPARAVGRADARHPPPRPGGRPGAQTPAGEFARVRCARRTGVRRDRARLAASASSAVFVIAAAAVGTANLAAPFERGWWLTAYLFLVGRSRPSSPDTRPGRNDGRSSRRWRPSSGRSAGQSSPNEAASLRCGVLKTLGCSVDPMCASIGRCHDAFDGQSDQRDGHLPARISVPAVQGSEATP